MRHKMMINEFIGRCSSNKGWRAPVRTGGLAAALITAGVWPRGGGGGASAARVSPSAWPWPWALSLTLAAFRWPAPQSGQLQPCHHRPLRAGCSGLGGDPAPVAAGPERVAASPASAL